MEPLREVFIVALLICTASAHHFLRGCQDVDPKCALLDEMRAAGDTVEAQRVCDIGTDHYCSKACNRCPDSQNVIMLVGGRKSGNNWYLNPRFFPLNGSLPACLDSTKSDIHSSLSQIRTPAIFVNQNGNPVMCVGHANLDECFEYEVSSDSWSIIGSTGAPGFIRGWDYDEEVGLIMAGSVVPDSQTVELTTDGGQTFQHLAEIPWGQPTEPELFGPCTVILDNNTAFFVGGADGDQGDRTSYCETYFLDLTTRAWTPGPNMIHCRFYHTCNMITNATSGHREIVVVGGFDQQREDHCKYIQEVEIFNLDTLQWRNATDFPRPIARHASLYFEDSFLIMGGDSCTGCSACSCTQCVPRDIIYQYSKVDDTWSELGVTLPETGHLMSAVFVENLC